MKALTKIAVSAAALNLAIVAVEAKSLWHSPANSEGGMFADRKASRIGDILTITISEQTNLSRNSQMQLSNNTNYDMDLSQFLWSPENWEVLNKGGERAEPDFGNQEAFDGSGSLTSNTLATSKTSVIVIDVLPNGNLVVEGARNVTMAGESQYAILRGIIRKDDVLSDNSVTSDRIANAEIRFMSKGDIAKSKNVGLMKKLLDTVNLW